jgi:hypothetical protein
METKVCKVCGQELPLSEFRKSLLVPNGIATCKKCVNEKIKKTKLFKETTGSTNTELAKFTPRELIEELKSRGYKGKLYVTRTIEL